MTKPKADSLRWKCPRCGSTKVQISKPTWYYETRYLEMKMVETDHEAQILWWYCLNCDESDSGEPIDLGIVWGKPPASPPAPA